MDHYKVSISQGKLLWNAKPVIYSVHVLVRKWVWYAYILWRKLVGGSQTVKFVTVFYLKGFPLYSTVPIDKFTSTLTIHAIYCTTVNLEIFRCKNIFVVDGGYEN